MLHDLVEDVALASFEAFALPALGEGLAREACAEDVIVGHGVWVNLFNVPQWRMPVVLFVGLPRRVVDIASEDALNL